MDTTSANDEELRRAAIKVKAEFETLIAGNNQLTIPDAVKVRDYIIKRTDLEKPDDMLTAEQRAWKIVYIGLTKELNEKIGEDKLSELDDFRIELNRIDTESENSLELLQIGRKIEFLLLRQLSLLDIHFSKDNAYRTAEDKMAEVMVAPSTPNQDRITTAKGILDILAKYKELVLDPLFNYQDEIYLLLTKFKSIYNKTSFKISDDKKELAIKMKKSHGEWLFFTEELHNARLKAITAVKNSTQLDAMLPNHIIANNGDISINLPTSDFALKCAAIEILGKEGMEKEQEIREKRTPLCIEVLGEPETYMKIEQNEPSTPDNFQEPASVAAGTAMSTWLPDGLGRKILIVIFLIVGLYGLVNEKYVLMLFSWLLMGCLSPRLVGETLVFIGRISRK